MKKIITTLISCLLFAHAAFAQGEENIWTFGYKASLNFSTTSPVFNNTQLFPGLHGCASICNAAGQLLFYTNGFWVWNKDHELFPELTGGVSGYLGPVSPTVGYPPMMPWNGGYATQPTAIASAPSQPGKYYIFSLSTSGTLTYSMVDMSLNGGKGGLITGKQRIYIASGLAEKLTVVKGCNNIWLVARSKTTNQYKSFEINDTGLVATPVISNCGNLPISWYQVGVIKFSPDGTKMAAACCSSYTNKGGLELYDFNRQTGVLSNALVLDSSSTVGYYYGACFSPDNSKLYASTSSFAYAGVFHYGKVHQFNLSLSTASAIVASHTVVYNDFVFDIDMVGDLKRGNDGKIYFSSGDAPFSSLHRINFPNNAGISCNAVPNAISLPIGTGSRGMSNDIALLSPPDTVSHKKNITICFRDTATIIADSGKLYLWDNSSTTRSRTVMENGTYLVRYINTDCKYAIDSINVYFVKLPKIIAAGYSCPGKKQGKVWVKPLLGDTTSFQYRWMDASYSVLQTHWRQNGDTLDNLDSGKYYLQILTASGCDTTLAVNVIALPVPEANFTADSLACKGVLLAFTNMSGAPQWKWYFGDGNYSGQQNPNYGYSHSGIYEASLVVTNIEGCSDTAYKEITVHGLDLDLRADKTLVNKGEPVILTSSGSEPYTVTAWEPAALFANQALLDQTIIMDTTRLFTVNGISAYGCIDKAQVEVDVNPMVFMPNCFTPNGDGLNDRFRPVSTGYIFVRYFEIYNRYGQQVYSRFGKSALDGWDGTFNGQLVDLCP